MLVLRNFKCLITATLIALTASSVSYAGEAPSSTSSSAEATHSSKLPNGLYLVLRQDKNEDKVKPVSAKETLLADDYHFLEPAEREPTRYVVLQTSPFIPLSLGGDPKEDREEQTGKPRLQLQLTEDQKTPLEEFTKAHVGETVAIVIGGDIVTTHLVRTGITGGKLQITRCTEHGCEVLFTKLLKKDK